MTNEYDYSNLYGAPSQGTDGARQEPEAPQGEAAQPAAPAAEPETAAAPAAETAQAAQTAAPQAEPAQTAAPGGYPNVGSSGMNTANTARTDYTEAAGHTAYTQNNTPYGAAQPGAPAYGQGSQNGYQYNYRYNSAAPNQNAPRSDAYTSSFGGGYNGYSYASAPQAKPKKKKGGAKKVLMRIGAGLLVLALGFAGGLGGAIVANRTGLAGGSQVVVQQVPRADPDDAAQGSAVNTGLTLQEVASIVAPSVVVITTEQMVSSPSIWFGGSYVQSGAGSGVVMSEDGYILTCAHVVSGAQNITVTMADETEYKATVVGADTAADIAVIKVDATGLTPAVMGDSDALAVGETVLAVGNPLGVLGGTATDGIISAINREISVQDNQMTLIQTNAAISPGNSGGGLFNAEGQLIGIVNAKSRSVDGSGNLTEAEGLGFAIPINTALDIAQDLIDVGYVKRPALGITVITIDDAEKAQQYGVSSYGVYIYQVTPGGGGDQAGLQMGDRIAAIEDIPVNTNSDLTDYLAKQQVGDTVHLQIERDGRLIEMDATLGVSEG